MPAISMFQLPELQNIRKVGKKGCLKKMHYYIHHVPGRLRVKIPLIRYRPHKAQAALTTLSGIDGIDDVKANTVTGSLVVHYDPDAVRPELLVDLLKEQGYLDEAQSLTKHVATPKAASLTGERLGRAFVGWVVGRILEANGMSFLAVLI